MDSFVKCPECGRRSRRKLVAVKSKAGKIYYYDAYIHKSHTHLVKLTRKKMKVIKLERTNKRLGLLTGPCPVCNKRRRYKIRSLNIRQKNGKTYSYKVYTHGSTSHYVKIENRPENHTELDAGTKLEPLLEVLLKRYRIGKKFTINGAAANLETEGVNLSYSTLKDRLGELVKSEFLSVTQESGVTYYSIPGSTLGILFKAVLVEISLFESEEGIIDGHSIKFAVKNKSPVRLEYFPYLILLDQPNDISNMNLKIEDTRGEENLKISTIKDEPKEKLFHIYFNEPLEPSEIYNFAIKYLAKETEKSFVYSASIETDSIKLCLKYHSPLNVNYFQVSPDRSNKIPLRWSAAHNDDVFNDKISCVEVVNPPKFSILEVKWGNL